MSATAPFVVGVDGSPASGTAVRWAALEAIRHHAPLHLVHAIALPLDRGSGVSVTPADFDAMRSAGDRVVTDAAGIAQEVAASTGGLVIDTYVLDPSPIPVLTERSDHARMIVLGTRGLGAFKRTVLGSVSTSLARHAHCPVAIIPEADADSPDRSGGPVVVGVDGSPCSGEAIHLAFDEASWRGADLVAVHSWNGDGHLTWGAHMDEEASALLAGSLAGFDRDFPDVTVRPVVTEVRPGKWLAEASGAAQLVVVGSHGNGGFAGMTLGSVSQAVLHGAEGPVVIVRRGLLPSGAAGAADR
ncbi:MAG: universal stress protein [Mycobacteriaceae bacterium]|nr:universal stress protein [Mycobacteriaceae bacterium]